MRPLHILAACALAALLLAPVCVAETVLSPLPDPIDHLFDQMVTARNGGKFEEALALAQRQVEVAQSIEGLEPSIRARLLDEVGVSQLMLGRYTDAEASYRKALEIREGTGKLSDVGIASTLNGLALALLREGRAPEAYPLAQRALSLLDEAGEPADLMIGQVLNTSVVLALVLNKPEVESDALIERMKLWSSAVMKKVGPSTKPDQEKPTETAATEFPMLEFLSRHAEDLPDADFEIRFSALIMRGYGAEQSQRLSKAEESYRRAADDAAHVRGPESREAGCAWNALAGLARRLGRSVEAEDLYRRAAAILTVYRPASSLDLSFAWLGLARLSAAAGRQREAREWYERALPELTEAVSEAHPFVASTLWELATLEDSGLPPSERTRLTQRARWIYDRVVAPELRKGDLGSLHKMADSVARMQEATECALRLSEQANAAKFGTSSLANSFEQAGQGYLWFGGFSQAVPRYQRALALRRDALGPEDPLLIGNLGELAAAELGWGHIQEGLAYSREATTLLDRRLAGKKDPREALREEAFERAIYLTHLDLLFETGGGGAPRAKDLEVESFAVGQRARASGTALTLEAAAARFASADAPLADLTQQFQSVAERRRRIDDDLLKSAGLPSAQRDLAAEALLRSRRAELDQELSGLRADLERRYPAYAELVFPRPVPAERARELLGPDEALLAYVSAPRSTFAWLVRKDGLQAVRLPVTREDLQTRVKQVRRTLDAASIRRQLGQGRTVPEFDVADAASLYHDLLLPLRSGLAGVRHLFVVPDGPLEGLPFAVLVTEAAPTGTELSKLPWLARELAVSVLPSTSSLAALRRKQGESRASRPFLGFGQPSSSVGKKTESGGDRLDPTESRLESMRALRRLADLQETRNELMGIAVALDASVEDLHFGEAVTKTAVRHLSLSDYHVLAFSTHALLAGEAGATEPALVLTPAGEGDDGRLTAREISELKLDADLVLLLGCNTAGPDGAPQAEGLSGLARAFFHAGSRALLVSQWSVPSEETVLLATGLFHQLRKDPKAGTAEGLRKSMLQMIESPPRPDMAHPFFWAAFVLVGDGARRPTTIAQ